MKEKKDCMQIADMRKEKRDNNIDQIDHDTKLKRQKLQTHKSIWREGENSNLASPFVKLMKEEIALLSFLIETSAYFCAL